MRTINEIIVHHSWTKDRTIGDFEAIKMYHTSWRCDGNIVTEDEAKKLQAEGKVIEAPWSDIGYHFVIEKDTNPVVPTVYPIVNQYVIRTGRIEEIEGSHCAGHNAHTLGICVVGNFDDYEPNQYQLYQLGVVMKYLFKKYGELKVSYHREYNSHKTCPGLQFNDKYKQISNLPEEVA